MKTVWGWLANAPDLANPPDAPRVHLRIHLRVGLGHIAASRSKWQGNGDEMTWSVLCKEKGDAARFLQWRPTVHQHNDGCGRWTLSSSFARDAIKSNRTLHVTVTETVRDEIDPGVTLLDDRSRPMAGLSK
jgi:hypothetical protein